VADKLYADDIPEEVKRRRNNELLAVQNAINLEENQALVGRQVEILVEGPSKIGRKLGSRGEQIQLSGRTVCDRIVVFDGPLSLTGQMLRVEIRKADDCTLFGQLPAPLIRWQ